MRRESNTKRATFVKKKKGEAKQSLASQYALTAIKSERYHRLLRTLFSHAGDTISGRVWTAICSKTSPTSVNHLRVSLHIVRFTACLNLDRVAPGTMICGRPTSYSDASICCSFTLCKLTMRGSGVGWRRLLSAKLLWRLG